MARKLSGIQLKSDDHHIKARNTIKQLASDNLFTDVTLVSDDNQTIQAHKAIIGHSSPYLFSLVKQSGKSINLPTKYSFVISILEYIYLGETRVEVMEIKEFLNMVNIFQIHGLWFEENRDNFK